MDAAETQAALATRVAQALAEAPSTFPSSEIADLIAETKAELRRLSDQHTAARRLSLSPQASPEAVAQARLEHEALSFQSERLAVALDYLQRANEIAQTREADLASQARLAQATAERDALAQELRETYVLRAGEIAALFARIRAFDATRPSGVDPVESAARGIKPNAIHWLLTSVHLPAFDPDAHARGQSLWPPPVVHAVPTPPRLAEASVERADYARQAAQVAAAAKQHEARSATRRLP